MKNRLSVNLLEALPQDLIFVRLQTPQREALFNGIKMSTLTALAEKTDIGLKNLSRYRSGQRAIPLNALLKLLKLSKLDIDNLQDRIELSVTKAGTPVKLGPKFTITDDWVYMAELIRGDGHIKGNLWGVYFVNKDATLIDVVKSFFEKLGLEQAIDLRTVNGVHSLQIRSMLVAYLLIRVFGVPPGRKGDMKLPAFYCKSKSYAAAAIRGAFDAEGSVALGNPSPRRIVIASISSSWLADLSKLLLLLRITSCIRKEEMHGKRQAIYRLYIYGQINLKRFLENVQPLQPARLRKLKQLLQTYDSTRSPEGSVKTKLLGILRRHGQLKRGQLAQYSCLKKSRLSWYLKSLKRDNMIEIVQRVYTNHGSYFTYGLTEVGLAELNSELGPLGQQPR